MIQRKQDETKKKMMIIEKIMHNIINQMILRSPRLRQNKNSKDIMIIDRQEDYVHMEDLMPTDSIILIIEILTHKFSDDE